MVEGAGKGADTKNATLWSRSSCLGGRRCRNTPDMKNATIGSHCHVWVVEGGGKGARTPET